MTRLLKVLMIVEQSEFRTSVQEFMEQNFSPIKVSVAVSTDQAFENLKQRPQDIILLDIDHPVRDWIDEVKHITSEHPGSVVIILSMLRDPELFRCALQAGAGGFVLKQDIVFELADLMNDRL